MKWLKTMVIAGLALGVAGGAWAEDVKVDLDRDANFGAIKTFNIKLGTSWGNHIGEKRVLDEFTEALTAKGWAVAAEGQADAQVVVHGASESKRTLNTLLRDGRVRLQGLVHGSVVSVCKATRPSLSRHWEHDRVPTGARCDGPQQCNICQDTDDNIDNWIVVAIRTPGG